MALYLNPVLGTILLFVSTVSIVCVFIKKFGRFLFLTSRIPGPSLWELVTKHAKKLLSDDMVNHILDMTASFGFKPWGTWILGGYVVFLSDPVTIGELFKNKNMYDKCDMIYDDITNYIGKGLLTTNGEEYRQHRKLAGPAFRKTSVESQLPLVNRDSLKISEQLAEKADGEEVDLRILVRDGLAIMAITFLTSGRNFYHNILHLFAAIVAGTAEISLRTKNPIYYWLVHRWKKSTKETEKMIRNSVLGAKDVFLHQKEIILNNEKEYTVAKPTSVTDILLQEFNRIGRVQTPELVDRAFSECLTVLVAGHDTTTFAMNTSLLLLALHPDMQEEIYREVQLILGDDDRYVQPEDLAQMVSLECFIKETLRLFTPLPIIGRGTKEETTLNGIVLPKGCTVFVNILALHRNPDVFKDPLKFDPGRFAPQVSAQRGSYDYIPFSSGFRNCPGQLQAMMALKTLLCYVIRRFKILPGKDLKSMDDIQFTMYFTLYLKHSSLRLVKRDAT